MWGCLWVSLDIVSYCLECAFYHLEYGRTVTGLLVLDSGPPRDRIRAEPLPRSSSEDGGTDGQLGKWLVWLARSLWCVHCCRCLPQERRYMIYLCARIEKYFFPISWRVVRVAPKTERLDNVQKNICLSSLTLLSFRLSVFTRKLYHKQHITINTKTHKF